MSEHCDIIRVRSIPMLVYCFTTVADGGETTLDQHWVSVSCFVGFNHRIIYSTSKMIDVLFGIYNNDYRDLFIKNMTNLNMKIEKNYPNKIIQLLFNFEVNAEVSRHCINFVKDIYASRSEV